MDILESKLTAPHLGVLLQRPRLVRNWENLSGKRLILVTAGAGYGKTTLTAQALTGPYSRNRTLVWYRLDRFDRDIVTFTRYLIQGLEKVFPKFKQAVAPDLFESAGRSQDLLLRVVKALESETSREIFIVLDDYHLLGPAGKNPVKGPGFEDVHVLMDFLLERLPGHVRFVLISRTDPPLKLSTLRVRGQILEIHESDLVFTADETTALFSRIHSQVPAPEILSAFYKQTGGWAAGLVLFRAALTKEGTLPPWPDALKSHMSKAHIFNFLEENLFDIQPPDMQQFMVRAALMDPMETSVCDRILGIDDSAARFRKMMAAHLMVFPVSEEETAFYYHHLFRDFLLGKLHQTLGESEILQLHLDIAGHLEAKGNFMALVHYIEACAYDDAVRLMEAFEMKFLIQGKIEFVRTCLEKIPGHIIEKNPRLLFMEAKQYSYFGRSDKSIACLTAACRILRETRSDDFAVKCMVDLGAQYYYTGHIPEARDLMVQVLDSTRTDPGTYILAVTYLCFFHSVLGDIRKSEMVEADARAVLNGFPPFERTAALAAMDISKIYRLYIKGDFDQSRELNLDLIARCKPAGLEAFMPLACYHASATDCILGRHETGLSFAQKGLRAAKKIHLRDSQSGWLYIARAENHLDLLHLDSAQTHASEALAIFRQPGNRWGMANALDLRAKISLARDDIPAARSEVSRALDVIRGYGLPMTEAIISNTLARVFMASNAFDKALDCLSRARKYLKPALYHLCTSWLLDARCCQALGRKEAAVKSFQKGLAIAEKKNFDRLVRAEAKDLTPLMAGTRPGAFFSALLEPSGFRSEPEPCRPEADLQGLKIRVLGRFKLWVGKREIDRSQWPGTKSLILFQYLAVHQSKGFISKDVLVEMLWPDQDPDKTGKRFNTAMSQLRKLLEPDLAPRSPSAYIQRKNDLYALSLGHKGGLDLAEFKRMTEKFLGMAGTNPKAVFAFGKKAESLYKGPLLGDLSYQDWCTRLRDEINHLYLRGCRKLIKLCRELKDPDSGIRFAQKFLWADPFDESMYRHLIFLFLETGRHGKARETFLACREKMKEMDCPLSPETLDLMKKAGRRPNNLDKI